MLESAGVECSLAGENVNYLLPGAFRVRLQVRVEDEQAARGLMDDPPADDSKPNLEAKSGTWNDMKVKSHSRERED